MEGSDQTYEGAEFGGINQDLAYQHDDEAEAEVYQDIEIGYEPETSGDYENDNGFDNEGYNDNQFLW